MVELEFAEAPATVPQPEGPCQGATILTGQSGFGQRRNLLGTGSFMLFGIERRGVLYLDTTWISAVTGTALFSRRQPVLPSSATEEQRFPWEPRAED